MGETILVKDRFCNKTDIEKLCYITLTSYSFPYFLFLCSNGASVQLQVEESGEMVGKLFSMLSVNVVGKNNGILQKGTIGVCLGGPVRGNIKVNYSRLHILTFEV